MNDISVFDHPKPNIAENVVCEFLKRDYGIAGTLEKLVSERDQNFLVTTADAQYVLKIANVAEERHFLELQNATLKHCAQVDSTLGIPKLIVAKNKSDLVDWTSNEGVHAVRLLTYLPGKLFSSAKKSPQLFASLGTFMGRLSRAMQGFGHPVAHRPDFLWNLDNTLAVKPWIADITTPERRALVERIFARYESRAAPQLYALRAAVLHQDCNDNNIVVDNSASPMVTGLIDFGDMTFGRQINELAITLAYALLDVDDIYAAARPVIAAYAQEFPLTGSEAEILFDLLAVRLATSVCISSHRAIDFPNNEYLLISQRPAFEFLERIDKINPAFLAAFARDAAGLAAVANGEQITTWLGSDKCKPHPLFDLDLNRHARCILSMTKDAEGMPYANDPCAYAQWLEQRFEAEDLRFAIGLYGEDRDVYQGDLFKTERRPNVEPNIWVSTFLLPRARHSTRRWPVACSVSWTMPVIMITAQRSCSSIRSAMVARCFGRYTVTYRVEHCKQ